MSGDTTILLAMLLIARCPHLLVFSLVGQSSCCNVSRGIPVLSLSYHPCTSLPPMLPLPILLLSINSSSRLKGANHRIISQRNGLVFFPSVSFCYTRNLDPCSHCVVPVSRDGGSSALCSPASSFETFCHGHGRPEHRCRSRQGRRGRVLTISAIAR